MKRGTIPKAIPLTSPANPSTTNGVVVDTSLVFTCSAQLIATGSAAGTFKMQASNDEGPSNYLDTFVPTNWTDVFGTSITVSGAGTYLITTTNLAYNYIRLVFVSTGTGTVVANMKILTA